MFQKKNAWKRDENATFLTASPVCKRFILTVEREIDLNYAWTSEKGEYTLASGSVPFVFIGSWQKSPRR